MTTEQVENIQNQVNTLKYNFRLFMVVMSVFIIATMGLIVNFQINISKYFISSDQNTFKQLETIPAIKKDYNVSITSFYNNSAISEVGYQMELKKQSISTKNTTNCFTPEPPPIINGCGFIVRPYATGITSQGTYLHTLSFNGNFSGNDRIAVDIRDNEKNEIVKSLGVVEGKSSDHSIKIPDTLKQNEQILVRLWPQNGSEITINEIIIEYFDIQRLQPTKLKISPELAKKYTGKSLRVYLDGDKNGLLDQVNDIEWSCVNGFPGIKPKTIEADSEIQLQRNDDCVTKNAPSSWKNDGGINALPVYRWLAVIDNGNGSLDIYPFETQIDISDYEIN